ncbi:MAG: hypothetical protein EXS48_00650 [Candidatus Staskawiczbacteria bacterium]|nr:hypothetical protein [Candidatus Staskawiczbacteria bacterium]
MKYLIVILWAYQDDVHAATDVQGRETWSGGDIATLEKGKSKGLCIWEFFQGKGITIEQARALLPTATFQLNSEKRDDPRIKQLEAWDDLRVQCISTADLQPLANHLGIPILVFATIDKYPRVPEFRSQYDPQPKE